MLSLATVPTSSPASRPRHRRRSLVRVLASGLLALSLAALAVPGAATAHATTPTPTPTTDPSTLDGAGPHAIAVGDRTVYAPAPPPAPLTEARAGHATLAPANPTFHVDYHGFSQEQQAAFQAAVDVWGTHITSPVTIEIRATISDMGSDILGGAGPNGWFESPSGDPGVLYPQALANAMAGYDVSPSLPDISASFDDNGAGQGWYLGTDGNTPNDLYDFESTVLHEIGHGLGFYATADSGASGCPVGQGCFGLNARAGQVQPSGFDTRLTVGPTGPHLLVNVGGRAWVSTQAPNQSAALLNVFRSQNIYFQGLYTDQVTWPIGARVYAPPSWAPASSMSHLDENAYPAGSPEALMTPIMRKGESAHRPGPMTLAMLADLGWHVPVVVDGPNLAFLRAAYTDFLNRLPMTVEQAQRVDDLGRHALTRGGLVNLLARSPEWVRAQVSSLYETILGRSADPAGLGYWSDRVATGQLTIAQLASVLYASDEGFAYLGGGSDAAWVTRLYLDVLGRTPDPAGQTYWMNLSRRSGRNAVAYAFYQSIESRTRRVSDLYQRLLGRSPESVGAGYWANYLANGDDVALAANLATSDEYYLRSSTRGL